MSGKRRPRKRGRRKGSVAQLPKPVGLPPGTAIYTGTLSTVGPHVEILDFDEAALRRLPTEELAAHARKTDRTSVTWVNVTGLHRVDLVQEVCRIFGVHPLVEEDVVSIRTRPKVEDYPEQTYIVVKMLRIADDEDDSGARVGRVAAEHTSIIVGANYVLTFQERDSDVFEPIRRRIGLPVGNSRASSVPQPRNRDGRMRAAGADYLAYALLDAIVDHYYVVLDDLRERAEALEDDLLDGEPDVDMSRIHELRRELVFLRKQVWPLRDAVQVLNRVQTSQFTAHTRPFLRDLLDHVHQVVEAIEMYREMVMGMVDLRFHLVSTRLNEVMRTLTIIATIFIPLTFIVGVYGMNFAYMPELAWRWGYPAVWALMIALALGMLVWFRRRGWF